MPNPGKVCPVQRHPWLEPSSCSTRQAFYEEVIAPRPTALRQLSVHVVGKAHQAELAADVGEGVTLLTDPASLHTRLPLADLEAADPGAPVGVPGADAGSATPAAKRQKGA